MDGPVRQPNKQHLKVLCQFLSKHDMQSVRVAYQISSGPCRWDKFYQKYFTTDWRYPILELVCRQRKSSTWEKWHRRQCPNHRRKVGCDNIWQHGVQHRERDRELGRQELRHNTNAVQKRGAISRTCWNCSPDTDLELLNP